MKRLLSFILVLCTLSTACMVCATESETENTPSVYIEELSGAELFATKLPIDSTITRKSMTWTQPNGYTAYRIWVENTTSVEMKVTIVDSKNKTQAFYVPSKGSKTFTNNHAVTGDYVISFYTGTVAPSGSVRVRISTESLL